MYGSTWKSTIRHFLPPLEVPEWHIFFKKRLFQVDSCVQFYRSMQLIFSTLLKGIIRKECQSFTNHGHDITPPTVFNPLSLWLTLPRDMGVSHTQWPPGITRVILACLWFAQYDVQDDSMYESTWKSTIRHFLPPLEVPVWHIFFKKRLFQVDSCIQFYRLMQLIFSTSFKGIIRKECQSFTNHGHDKTPPTVFNPLSLWLTLTRDMGVSHTLWSPGITRAILACLWFAQSWCSGWFYVLNFIGWCNLFFQHYYR